MPLSEDLDMAIRRAATIQGVTVSAWVRERLLDALRAPERPASAARLGFARIPRAWTVREASALLDVSPDVISRQLRTGQLAGFIEQKSFYDPGRGRFLRRRWWKISGAALLAYMEARTAYWREHGLRPYKRRPRDLQPTEPLADEIGTA